MTETKTFPVKLTSAYVADTIVEVVKFAPSLFEIDERVAIYLEAVDCLLDISKSIAIQIYPKYDGSETDAEKFDKFQKAQNRSQKIGLQFLKRKASDQEWFELTDIVLENSGTKRQLDLLPRYLTQASIRILEKDDIVGVKLFNYGHGLIKGNDYINLDFSVRLEIKKKDDLMIELLEEIMGFNRVIQEQVTVVATGSTVTWPNTMLPTEATVLGTTPVLIAIDRTATMNRKKFMVENDGSSPVIFSYGGTTVLSPNLKTGVLYPGDAYIDDHPVSQGPWSAALPSGTLPPGRLNIYEGITII